MEIEKYFPSAIKETKEFNAIANAENPMFIQLWYNLKIILKEVFIMTMGIDGIERFEKMLDIVPESEDLEERRSIIIAALFNRVPFTLPYLEEKTKTYFGEKSTVEVDYNNYAVFIRADKNYNEQRKAFKVLLKKILPANLLYYLIQYVSVSNELKFRPNLGGSVFIKLPLGITNNCSTVRIKSCVIGSKFTQISSDENGQEGLYV